MKITRIRVPVAMLFEVKATLCWRGYSGDGIEVQPIYEGTPTHDEVMKLRNFIEQHFPVLPFSGEWLSGCIDRTAMV